MTTITNFKDYNPILIGKPLQESESTVGYCFVKVYHSWKYWQELKFGGWVPNCHRKCIGGFKLDGSVWDHYMYKCE